MLNKDKLKTIFQKASAFIVPPPVLAPSLWTEANITVPDGPMAGQKMKLYSFQREMIDSITEGKKKIVLKTSAQIGKTSILNAILFYQMKHSGHNIGVLQSSDRELRQWIAGKVKPTISRTPMLAEMVTSKSDKNSVNNNEQIQLVDGTFIYMMSLGSPRHLRGKTIATALLDEIDAVNESTATADEGDPVLLADQRTTTFGDDALVVLSSTPTTKQGSINVHWEQSDQRHFYVPCPYCGHRHVMKWESVKFDWQEQQGKKVPVPATAKYHCPECDKAWTDGDRIRAVALGHFVALNPKSNIIGFHVNRLVSPLSTIVAISQDFADAYSSFSLQTFYNTALGETYDDLNEDPGNEQLAVLMDHNLSIDRIPDDVVFLVGGADQQKDRLEITTLGVSEKAIYVLDHRSFYDIDCERVNSPAYTNLINFIKSPFKDTKGNAVPMLWTNLDSSNGRATTAVYRNCNRYGKLHAIKGASNVDAPLIPVKPTKTGGQELYMLGVNVGKTIVREMINRSIKGDAPQKLVISATVPDDYAEQLLSEELKKVGTRVRWVLKKGQERNEALDCMDYAVCASRQVLKNASWEKLKAYKQRKTAKAQEDAPAPADDVISDDFVPAPQPKPEPVTAPPTTLKKDVRKIVRPSRQRKGWFK